MGKKRDVILLSLVNKLFFSVSDAGIHVDYFLTLSCRRLFLEGNFLDV